MVPIKINHIPTSRIDVGWWDETPRGGRYERWYIWSTSHFTFQVVLQFHIWWTPLPRFQKIWSDPLSYSCRFRAPESIIDNAMQEKANRFQVSCSREEVEEYGSLDLPIFSSHSRNCTALRTKRLGLSEKGFLALNVSRQNINEAI